MARRIIVYPSPIIDAAQWSVSGVFWLAAPANNVVPKPAATSIIPPVANAPTWGITAAELTALQNGTVIEVPFGPIVVSTQGFTLAQMPGAVAAKLVVEGSAAQTTLNVTTPATKFIGSSWDGATWTVGP